MVIRPNHMMTRFKKNPRGPQLQRWVLQKKVDYSSNLILKVIVIGVSGLYLANCFYFNNHYTEDDFVIQERIKNERMKGIDEGIKIMNERENKSKTKSVSSSSTTSSSSS